MNVLHPSTAHYFLIMYHHFKITSRIAVILPANNNNNNKNDFFLAPISLFRFLRIWVELTCVNYFLDLES